MPLSPTCLVTEKVSPSTTPQVSDFEKSLPSTPYDLVVIGGGPGGYVAALRGAQLGLKTALVEGKHLGGVCLNWGCIPTKALLKSASMMASAEHMKDFGLILPQGEIKIDLETMVARSRKIAGQLQGGVKGLLAKNGVAVFSAWAKFQPVTPKKSLAPFFSDEKFSDQSISSKNSSSTNHIHALRLTKESGESGELFGKNIIIATGARARTLFPEDLGIWSAHQAMTPPSLPKSLLIIGAGAIGVEFASFYCTLGTKVTLVEQAEGILPVEDGEIVAIAEKSFLQQGIIIETRTLAREVKRREDGSYNAILKHTSSGVEKSWTGDAVLVAIGVRGNTENLGLEHTAVRVSKDHIVTHAHHCTDELGVYAIGDVAGAPWLAHKASHEGIACVEYIAGLPTHPSDKNLIPGCTYSMPQIASIGLTEKIAAERGPIKVGRFPFSANGQAMAYGESTGLVKVIFHETTGELLGAHMVGAGVSELIQGFAIAKSLQATEEDLKRVIFPHPTFSEMMHEAVLDADAMALHLFRSLKK